MATTATQTTRSFLETLQDFSNRSTNKRRKLNEDPVEHFVQLAPTILSTTSVPPHWKITRTSKASSNDDTSKKKSKDETSQEEKTETSGNDETNSSKKESKDDETPEEKKKTSEKISSSKSSEWQADVKRYQKLLDKEREEMESITKTRKEIHEQQVELWGVYKYGLEKIAGLNDLGDAPDAILPGNF